MCFLWQLNKIYFRVLLIMLLQVESELLGIARVNGG